ncbi:hypothetical protein BACCIP111895_03651 [Neobacillus rhizosphaerae]|uniref:Sporulation protein YjcZ n=1 Tax=Neobacillus rhizosphaerae TaxID=2880965 RepID=A0ABM9EUX6_9BACI|nr:hypothetical protein BACCIP111895_03651 [Neobacillus rhizosphaerae]
MNTGHRGGILIYKKQERMLIWLAFIVAFIIGLSIIGRIFSG